MVLEITQAIHLFLINWGNKILSFQKDKVDSLRPILKVARQKRMNGCPKFSSKKDLEESFTFAVEDAKFGTKPLEIYIAVKWF